MIKIIKFLQRYMAESRHWKRTFPQNIKPMQLVRYFPRWYHCLQDGRSPIVDEQPWITFAAIDYLLRIIISDSYVFEWGVGGSTLFLIKRARKVVSVEHNRSWFEQIREILALRNIQNWDGILVEPKKDQKVYNGDPSEWDSYLSSDLNFRGFSFRAYVEVIESYNDASFDVILIDGRARPSCFKHALKKVKIGGFIFWDNTDRSEYGPIIQKILPSFKMIDLPGPSPYVNFFTRTTIWQRLS